MSSPIKVFYDGQWISPGPTVSINKEFIYNNDTVIGYNYVFNLNGYASSFNKKNGNTSSNLKNVIQSLDDIHSILHRNGKIFRLYCPDTGEDLVTAYGGHLRSFDVQESDNKWTQYARYSAQIEFTRVIFDGNNIEIADDTGHTAYSNYLLKLKSFSDNWNFNTSEDSLYKYYRGINDITGVSITEDYSQIEVEYTINATGKHYYLNDTTTQQAWEVAKEFVQKKLYDQLSMFKTSSPLGYFNFSSSLYNSNEIGNIPQLNQSHSYVTNIVAHPILSSSMAASYKIFNEKINCSSSQSDGSFSATYSCILQYVSGGDNNNIEAATHSFDVSYEKTRSFESNLTSISVNGTVTGLLMTQIELAAVDDGGTFYLPLPNSGPFLATSLDTTTKYLNALTSFNNQIVNVDYSDLTDAFKSRLDINYQTLFPDTTGSTTCVQNLKLELGVPKSFSVSHNYGEGSITYTAEYDNERACAVERGFESFTVTEEDPVPIIAEFVVPGRENGPIIQYLGTYTHKKVSLEFSGTTKKGCQVGTPWAPNFSGTGICETSGYVNIPAKVNNLIVYTEEAARCSKQKMITTSHSINYNPVDGSYSLSKNYIICPKNINSVISDCGE
jgi:hypothetical protein